MDFSKEVLGATEFQLGVLTKKGGPMSKLTDRLVQALLISVIAISLVGGIYFFADRFYLREANYKQTIRDYGIALREAQTANKVITSTKN